MKEKVNRREQVTKDKWLGNLSWKSSKLLEISSIDYIHEKIKTSRSSADLMSADFQIVRSAWDFGPKFWVKTSRADLWTACKQCCGWLQYDCRAHVLVHLLKSFNAYNVNSSSTLFLDNIQWNFEISFPSARLLIQLDYKNLGPSEIRLFRLVSKTEDKHAFMCDILLWKIFMRISIKSTCIRIAWIYIHFPNITFINLCPG